MSDSPRERRSTRAATAAYIAAVAALAVALGIWSGLRYGLPDPAALLVFLLFAVCSRSSCPTRSSRVACGPRCPA